MAKENNRESQKVSTQANKCGGNSLEENRSTNTRRRFLRFSGTVCVGTLAGCFGEKSVSSPQVSSTLQTSHTTTKEKTISSEPTTTTETTQTQSKPELRTEYNSRKKFSSPGIQFDNFEALTQ